MLSRLRPESFEERRFYQRRQHGRHREPHVPPLAEIIGMDHRILPLQNELDGQPADLEELPDTEAYRQCQFVIVIGFPVDRDVRRCTDLPLTREKPPDEILDIGLAGGFAIVVSGKGPPMLRENPEDPFLSQMKTHCRRAGLPLFLPQFVFRSCRKNKGRPCPPKKTSAVFAGDNRDTKAMSPMPSTSLNPSDSSTGRSAKSGITGRLIRFHSLVKGSGKTG